MDTSDSSKALIDKKTLYAGTKAVDFKNGTKVHFHFVTKLCDQDKTVLDDSRKLGDGKPMELVLGKKFKLEVWEVIVQKMALNEVAQFTVDKSLVVQYPFVAKTLRDIHRPEGCRTTHHCAMSLQNQGVGYDDLNAFLSKPSNLEFTIELVKVEQPEDYEKETWQMEVPERIEKIPQLKQQGNEEYRKKNYAKAAEMYATALSILEQLMLNEKPHDVEWDKYNQQKLPILLNYAQCKLNEGDYYSVITHCTDVIKYDKDNVKAYYRRAKAHVGAWNVKEAREDFETVIRLDPKLEMLVQKELNELEEQVKIKDAEDKEKLKNMFT
ncbi:AH receptor-interacting protein [Aethina tumida]|uniref:AH receptor-interacting protein n=1 Tax=Aethina tumida TaxID=116153 RepID=UPI00096B2A3C|nr:AH receptor-interacting protein [Aethina tumida]